MAEDFQGREIDLIIKLGGSIITHKDQLEMVNSDAIDAAGKLVKAVRKAGLRCIVCHGAGSFGHLHARKYSIKKGFNGLSQAEAEKMKEGFCLTHLSVTKLQRLIVEKLVSLGLPAVGVSPCGGWKTQGGEVIQHNVREVYDLVYNGFIPVIHGDAVLDVNQGCDILSGDTIIKTLCDKMDIRRVVFLSDVPGIYNKPPSEPDAQHLPVIYINRNGTCMEKVLTDHQSFDVTGGMKLKINCACDIVRNSYGKTQVFVCHLMSDIAEDICCHGNRYTDGHGLCTVVTLLDDT